MKFCRFIGVFFLLCGALAFSASEFPRSQGHVNDFAHMFSPHTTETLESRLVDFEKTTTNQVAVVTIDTLNGRDIEGYANQLFREWGIGQKEKNNGVLILFVKNERKSRIEVGRGLEAVVPDAICKTILDRDVKPEFKQGNFDKGATNAVVAVTTAIAGKYVTSLPSENNDGLPLGLSLGAWIMIIVIILIMLVIIFAYIDDNSSGGSSSYYSSCGSDSGGGSSWGGGDSGGGGASSDW